MFQSDHASVYWSKRSCKVCIEHLKLSLLLKRLSQRGVTCRGNRFIVTVLCWQVVDRNNPLLLYQSWHMFNQASLYDSRSDPFSLCHLIYWFLLIASWWLLISCLLPQFKAHPFGHLNLPSSQLLCMNTASKWNRNLTSELEFCLVNF